MKHSGCPCVAAVGSRDRQREKNRAPVVMPCTCVVGVCADVRVGGEVGTLARTDTTTQGHTHTCRILWRNHESPTMQLLIRVFCIGNRPLMCALSRGDLQVAGKHSTFSQVIYTNPFDRKHARASMPGQQKKTYYMSKRDLP